MKSDSTIAYFTARLMLSLNSYAIKNNMYCNINKKKYYRGKRISYSSFLHYKRAKGKIITSLSFISTSEEERIAQMFGKQRKDSQLFVMFIIENLSSSNFIQSGVDISSVSEFPFEKEFLFLPFSFYLVKEVKIDTSQNIGQIYLQSKEKTEIFEEKLSNDKEIDIIKKKE